MGGYNPCVRCVPPQFLVEYTQSHGVKQDTLARQQVCDSTEHIYVVRVTRKSRGLGRSGGRERGCGGGMFAAANPFSPAQKVQSASVRC